MTDSFYKSLEFGTGGMRGEMGVGSNRMNKYTVGACPYLVSIVISLNLDSSVVIKVINEL